MLQIVYGQTDKTAVLPDLVGMLTDIVPEGTLYIGYPILTSADASIAVDAMLVSEIHGLVAFIIKLSNEHSPSEHLIDEQNRLKYALKNSLGRYDQLRKGADLAIDIRVATLVPPSGSHTNKRAATLLTIDELPKYLKDLKPVDVSYRRALNAAIQRVSTIKPHKKRTTAITTGSRGAILKQIEKQIANLDQWQKRAAIETPDGPQRIRGLAGSGKTVVLALKAAYLHAQNPDWTIALTFYSRSLYQQLTDLVRRFCFEHLGDEPNWDKLKILHAWGGTGRPGLYTEIADHIGADARDFAYGQAKFGMNDAFRGVCAELLASVPDSAAEPLFDAVLIDEAQDLPPEFLKLVYLFVVPPKRLIWAYDELQNLSDVAMVPVSDVFGVDDAGRPVIALANTPGQARQDIVLPVCYRNTPWALTLAHALGLGVYRSDGLVQHFDDPAVWTEVGYELLAGQLQADQEVTLRRRQDSYPSYFTELLTCDDAIRCEVFENSALQADWLATQIKRNLTDDELEADDILVILPNAFKAKRQATEIMLALNRKRISAHVAGVTTSADDLFVKGSIAISNVYRAKGNESPMVYVLHSEYGQSDVELIKRRNILFTCITRSKAWVRLCGIGSRMAELKAEIDKVSAANYRLTFPIPDPEKLKHIRTIHRDRTAGEKATVREAQKALSKLVNAIRSGDIALENLSKELREQLKAMISKDDKD